ncbi:HipA family kinase [Pseudomonas luteola]|uniref:HipA family kinase n=1 Tax=Pseudomonas luteola TaxID=47886 RepID=UPI00289F9F6D|nr:HipA family kinase [Pseudomonas luteola]
MVGEVSATEIIKRSDQGISVQPFIIRADDGHLYFVKGYNRAGGPSLISEVIAAELGSCLGLPIPEWRIMHISEPMIAFSAIPGVSDLSGGPAFASRQVENVNELMMASIPSVDADLRLKLLVFDWWIQNGDRGFGNVNLMTDAQQNLVVIDHNSAFEAGLDLVEFKTYHVFRDELPRLRDYVTRQMLQDQLDEALSRWDSIIQLLPREWLFRDADEVDETEPTLGKRLETLQLFRDERFWGQL